MNILLINQYAGSPFHGMEYRPYYLAREWIQSGHHVTILAASFSHVRSRAPNLTGRISEEMIDGVRYVWLKTPGYQGNGAKRAINIFSFVLNLVRFSSRIVGKHSPDAVIASSTHPLDIIPAWRIAKAANANLVYEVHDLWPLTPIEIGGMSRAHPFVMVLQWAENFAYRQSDIVISMLPKAKDHMRLHGMAPHKFVHIPNGIVAEEWQNSEIRLPEEHTRIFAKLKDRFVVGYAGAHGLANALHNLVAAAALLQDKPVAFVLTGQGPEKERLQQMTQQQGLKNLLFLPSVPRQSVPALLKEMDALYIGLKKEPLFRFGISPNKLMDYMMAAKPVINAIEAGNDPVTENGCGISVPSENPQKIADAVMKLAAMPVAERENMGSKGKRYVIANHDYKILAMKFLSALMKETRH